jgi:hypothetical protein
METRIWLVDVGLVGTFFPSRKVGTIMKHDKTSKIIRQTFVLVEIAHLKIKSQTAVTLGPNLDTLVRRTATPNLRTPPTLEE